MRNETPVEKRNRIIVEIAKRKSSVRLANLARRLKGEIEKSGLSKTEFAAMIGVSDSELRYLLHQEANPTIAVLCHLALELRTSLFELLEGEALLGRRNASAEEMGSSLASAVRAQFQASSLSEAQFAAKLGISDALLMKALFVPSDMPLLRAEEIGERFGVALWHLLGLERVGAG